MKKSRLKKTSTTRQKQKTLFGLNLTVKGAANNGALYAVVALGIIGLFAAVTTGGITPSIDKLKTAPTPGPQYTCCDSGNGADCHPIQENQITYNGSAYGLLKSNILIGELQHAQPTNSYTPDGHRIFINTTGSTGFDASKTHGQILPGSGCVAGQNQDYVGLDNPQKYGAKDPYWGGYFCTPHAELIYVCEASAQECGNQVNADQTPFDVYYRLSDGPVPSPISTECPVPEGNVSQSPQQIVGVPTPGGRKNLQLETFQIKQAQKAYPWLGAWCKPAINLYPTQKTTVHVTVAPKGNFNLTIPQYSQNGWTVTAYPDGKIQYNNQNYPYLYYEAAIEDKYIQEPKDGYIVAYDKLNNLFATILPQLGLSTKEQTDFTTYWLKALPNSPYYFVGVIPQSQIDDMAPLSISPTPDSILRVSLYFKALDKNNLQVQAPQFTNFSRNGFTVTEWGGIVKTDPSHPFSCLM